MMELPTPEKILDKAAEEAVYAIKDISASGLQLNWSDVPVFHVCSEEPPISLHHVLEDRIQRRFHPRVMVMDAEDIPVNVLSDAALTSRFSPREFMRNQAGVSALELGIVLPVLALLLIGGIEYTRYILVNQKLDKATNTTADLITRTTVNVENLSQFAQAMDGLMSPYEFRDSDVVIFTGVNRSDNQPPQPPHQPYIAWQKSFPPGEVGRSRIGAEKGIAHLPGGLTLNNKEVVVVAESFYTFKPLLGENPLTNTFFPTELRNLYKVAVYRPRLGEAVECEDCGPCTTNCPQPAPNPPPVCPEPMPEPPEDCLPPREPRLVPAPHNCKRYVCRCPDSHQTYDPATNTCNCVEPYVPYPPNPNICWNPQPTPEPEPEPEPTPQPRL